MTEKESLQKQILDQTKINNRLTLLGNLPVLSIVAILFMMMAYSCIAG